MHIQAFRKAVILGEQDSTGTKVLEAYVFLINSVVLRKGKAKGRYQDALELWDQAIRTFPKYPSPYGWKGTILYKMGRVKEATEPLEIAVKSGVKEPEIFHHLGLCYLQGKREKEARGMFASALQLDPKHAAAAAEIEKLKL